jgi:hypothetical protein
MSANRKVLKWTRMTHCSWLRIQPVTQSNWTGAHLIALVREPAGQDFEDPAHAANGD